MKTDIQLAKIELIQWITTLEDESIIRKIVSLREKKTKDWWSEISAEEKESIEKGISDADAGKLKPHSDAREIYGKWL